MWRNARGPWGLTLSWKEWCFRWCTFNLIICHYLLWVLGEIGHRYHCRIFHAAFLTCSLVVNALWNVRLVHMSSYTYVQGLYFTQTFVAGEIWHLNLIFEHIYWWFIQQSNSYIPSLDKLKHMNLRLAIIWMRWPQGQAWWPALTTIYHHMQGFMSGFFGERVQSWDGTLRTV